MPIRKRRHIPRNIKQLLKMLAARGPTGTPEEIETVAVLVDHLRRQYGDREWTEQEVVAAMEQILA